MWLRDVESQADKAVMEVANQSQRLDGNPWGVIILIGVVVWLIDRRKA